MGFWSSVANIVATAIDEVQLDTAHPSLKQACRRFEAQGYEIESQTPLSMVLAKQKTFGTAVIQLTVAEDGSIVVDERGVLTESQYLLPGVPGAPTVTEFQAIRASADAPPVAAQGPSQLPQIPAQPGQASLEQLSRAWTVLGVPPGTAPTEITARYRALLGEYHPDRYATAPVEFRELAETKTREVVNAYEIISANWRERHEGR